MNLLLIGMSFMLTLPRQIVVFPSADTQRKQETINREIVNEINPSVFIMASNVVLRTLSNHPAMPEEHGWL